MFGTLGGPELILIFIVGLVVFGPRKLPEIGKSVGKMIGEFRRASADFQRTIEDEVETEKLRKDDVTADYASPGGPKPPAIAALPGPEIREAEPSVPSSASSAPPVTAPGSGGADLPAAPLPGDGEKSASS